MEIYAAFGAGLLVGVLLTFLIAGLLISALDTHPHDDLPMISSISPIDIEPELTIKVAYMPGMKPLYQANPGEWYDLRAGVTTAYNAGDQVCIPLGVSIELPAGYEAKIEPRSSTARKHGLSYDDSGVIDNRWRKEWGSTWIASRNGVVRKNTRIAQFRLQRVQPRSRLVTVDQVEDTDRGGYGSTGEE